MSCFRRFVPVKSVSGAFLWTPKGGLLRKLCWELTASFSSSAASEPTIYERMERSSQIPVGARVKLTATHQIDNPQQDSEDFSRTSDLESFNDDESTMSFLEVVSSFFRIFE